MLTLEQIQVRLEDCNLKAVAKKIGVHENTLYRLNEKTSYKTVERISQYFEERETVRNGN